VKAGINIVNIESNVQNQSSTLPVKKQSQSENQSVNFENILKESIAASNEAKSSSKKDKAASNTAPSDEDILKKAKVPDKDSNKSENKLKTAEAVIKESLEAGKETIRKSDIPKVLNLTSKEKAKKILSDTADDVTGIYSVFHNILKSENKALSSNNLPQETKNEISTVANDIKDALKLIKSAGNLKDLKTALEKLDKLSKTEGFKSLLKLAEGSENQSTSGFKELITKLPKLVDRLDKIIKNFQSNINVLNDITMKFVKEKLSEYRSDDVDAVRNFRTKMHYENRYSREAKNESRNSEQNGNSGSDNKSPKSDAQIRNQDNSSVNINQSISQRNDNSFYKNIQTSQNNSSSQNYSPRDVFNQIAKNIKFTSNEGKKELWVHIEPPELGKVKVSLILENGKVHAKFGVEKQGVKDILEQFKGDIVKQLEQSGLRVDSVDIDFNSSGGQNSGAGKRHLQYLESIANKMSAPQSPQSESGVNIDTRLMSSDEYYGSSGMPSWLASEVNVTI
jgi:flagellar hook-length control protein FliK